MQKTILLNDEFTVTIYIIRKREVKKLLLIKRANINKVTNISRKLESLFLFIFLVAGTSMTNNEAPSLSRELLTLEEQNAVNQLSNKIQVLDSASIMQYGAPVQNKISKFSDSVLQNIRGRDIEQVVGTDLTNLVVTIKDFDPVVDKKPIFPFFGGLKRGAKKQMDKFVSDFSTVEENVDKIISSLEAHQRQLLKDINMMESMYNNNYEYFKELSLYIVAGEEKLLEFRNNDIADQQKIVDQTGDQMEAQKLNDMVNQAGRFEKRLHDLKLSRTISIQMAPQIRLIQNNNNVLVEKIQSSIVNSIPIWKNQIVIALGIANSKKALEAQKKVTDMTNELLLKNSEMLKQGSLEIAEEAERSIVSIETLQATNANLIDTINGVLDIQRQGSEARAQAEDELQKLENDLKNTLLSVTR